MSKTDRLTIKKAAKLVKRSGRNMRGYCEEGRIRGARLEPGPCEFWTVPRKSLLRFYAGLRGAEK